MFCLPLLASGSCVELGWAAAKLRTQRVKEGGGPAADSRCMNLVTHLNTLTHGYFIGILKMWRTKHEQVIFFVHSLGLFLDSIQFYGMEIKRGHVHCKRGSQTSSTRSVCVLLRLRMTSLRRLWHLAVRWWTPGWAWLSCRASPWPQSGRSSPEGPLCIQATRLRWPRPRTRLPPEQTADNYHLSVNMKLVFWSTRREPDRQLSVATCGLYLLCLQTINGLCI